MSDLTPVFLAYTTVAGEADARRIARGLVNERLAACVNIAPASLSIYPWQGQLEEAREQVLTIKTTESCIDAIGQWLGEHHPYEVFEYLAVPVAQASDAYASWVRDWVGSSTVGEIT